MNKQIAGFVFLIVCLVLAALLLMKAISPILSGSIFAIALVVLGICRAGLPGENDPFYCKIGAIIMTAGEVKFLNWAFLILGTMLTFSGWRAIGKRRTRAEGRDYEGKPAARLGWLWLIIGLLLLLAALLDITILKNFGKLFLESTS
jgi:hypothetical protein